jgi:hypothetical protein
MSDLMNVVAIMQKKGKLKNCLQFHNKRRKRGVNSMFGKRIAP